MKSLELAREDFIGARSQQQDRAAVDVIDETRGGILILADGLGGHEGGAQASAIVEQTFLEAAKKGAFNDPARRRMALRDALEAANKTIGSGVDPAHGHRGMASTAVVAIVAEGNVTWISIGDSHLYVWRAGKLIKLNEDHSQAGLMIRSGQYKETDPEVLAAKSVLVSALTGRKLEIVDHPQNSVQLEAGDVLILASDGLNTISEPEISEIVSKGNGQDAKLLCKALIEAVKERKADRQDNTTVAIARVLQVPKRQTSDNSVPLAPPPRQDVTTPTELPSARVETHVPVKPRTPDRPATNGDAPAPRAPGLADNTVRSVPILPPKPSSPDARTAIPNAADARTAVPDAADARTALPGSARRPAPELQATRPISPEKGERKPKSVMGIAMLALATLLLVLVIGRTMDWFDPIASVSRIFRPDPPPVQAPSPEGRKKGPTGGVDQPPAPPAKTKLPDPVPVQPPKQPQVTPTPPPTAPAQPPSTPPGEQPVEGRPSAPDQTPKPPGPGQQAPPQAPRTQAPGQPPQVPPQARPPSVERPVVLDPLPAEPIRPAPPQPDLPDDRRGGIPGAPTQPRDGLPDDRRRSDTIPDNLRRDFSTPRGRPVDPDQPRAEAGCRPARGVPQFSNRDECYQYCADNTPPRDRRFRNPELERCVVACNNLCSF